MDESWFSATGYKYIIQLFCSRPVRTGSPRATHSIPCLFSNFTELPTQPVDCSRLLLCHFSALGKVTRIFSYDANITRVATDLQRRYVFFDIVSSKSTFIMSIIIVVN